VRSLSRFVLLRQCIVHAYTSLTAIQPSIKGIVANYFISCSDSSPAPS
jgi:hypothetical protein